MSTLPLYLVNYCKDPRALNKYNSSAVQAADGKHWKYPVKTTNVYFAGGVTVESVGKPLVYYARILSDNPGASWMSVGKGVDAFEGKRPADLLATKVTDGSCFVGCNDCAIVELGIYDWHTWDILLAAYRAGRIASPWFAADSADSRLTQLLQ